MTRGLDQKVVHPYLPSHIRSKYKKNTATPYWNHGANLKDQKGIHDWDVIKHTVLEDIAQVLPLTRKELMDVRGVGKATWDRYGEEILAIVRDALDSLEESTPNDADEGGDGASLLEQPLPAPPEST